MCSKSRQALAIVEKNTSEFEIVEYLKNPLTVEEIKVLLPQLNIKASELVRTQEAIWKDITKNCILDIIISFFTCALLNDSSNTAESYISNRI